MRYFIDRKAAIDILEVAINDDWEFDYAKDRMIELSTQPEIILCKECIYRFHDASYGRDWCNRTTGVFRVTKDDFCSYAERKTDGSD